MVHLARRGFAAKNLATLRRLALNLFNLDNQNLISKHHKRLKDLLYDTYLPQLLGCEMMPSVFALYL